MRPDPRAELRPAAQRVLALLRASKRPMKAYDLIAAFSDVGGRTHPPTVYRALDQLQVRGLVHRASSLFAFVACGGGCGAGTPILLVCTNCSETREFQAPELNLSELYGFQVERTSVEIAGLCPACQQGSSAGA